jgi:hypothetical protein
VTEASDLTMMTDVEARRALTGRELRYRILSPLGAWMGRGNLRVLRVKALEDNPAGLDVTLGYESYEKCRP